MTMTDQNAWATIAAMLGTTPEILRAAAEPWAADPKTPPINGEILEHRLIDLIYLARQLNNTNLAEQAITDNLDQQDIPLTVETPGVRRLANEPLKKVDCA
jgi:hypothetical protein